MEHDQATPKDAPPSPHWTDGDRALRRRRAVRIPHTGQYGGGVHRPRA